MRFGLARSAIVLALGAAAAVGIACGAGGFDSQSKVNSVRLFGVKPDKPYAAPGETVTLEVLMTDARKDKPRPLKNFWIPLVCVNPREDLYYLCFIPPRTVDGGTLPGGARLIPPFPATDAGAGDAGAALPPGAGQITSVESIPTNIDLGPFLPQGTKFSFQMPADAIENRLGTSPYGLAIVFNIACAGQVRFVNRSGGGPQQIPLQCTDESGEPLGADDYVIGINRVYSYPDRTNTNPVVESVSLDGGVIDRDAGFTIQRCVAERRADCPPVKFGVRVSDSSWEENPGTTGGAQREQIWVTYYSDLGDLGDEARLLFDSRQGRIDDSDVEFRAPYTAAEGTVWAVVHDNRAGAEFVVVPLHVK